MLVPTFWRESIEVNTNYVDNMYMVNKDFFLASFSTNDSCQASCRLSCKEQLITVWTISKQWSNSFLLGFLALATTLTVTQKWNQTVFNSCWIILLETSKSLPRTEYMLSSKALERNISCEYLRDFKKLSQNWSLSKDEAVPDTLAQPLICQKRHLPMTQYPESS